MESGEERGKKWRDENRVEETRGEEVREKNRDKRRRDTETGRRERRGQGMKCSKQIVVPRLGIPNSILFGAVIILFL
jgi:hypothetical protein